MAKPTPAYIVPAPGAVSGRLMVGVLALGLVVQALALAIKIALVCGAIYVAYRVLAFLVRFIAAL